MGQDEGWDRAKDGTDSSFAFLRLISSPSLPHPSPLKMNGNANDGVVLVGNWSGRYSGGFPLCDLCMKCVELSVRTRFRWPLCESNGSLLPCPLECCVSCSTVAR